MQQEAPQGERRDFAPANPVVSYDLSRLEHVWEGEGWGLIGPGKQKAFGEILGADGGFLWS